MRTRILTAVFGLALIVALAPPAAADLEAYMQVVGATQGSIQGDSTTTNYTNHIPTLEYHHLMERPAGQSVQHQSVIVTLRLEDSSVPKLMTAMGTDESLTVIYRFVRPDGGSPPVTYTTVTLTGAKIVAFEPLSPRSDDPDLANLDATVRLRFSYTSIQHSHLTGGSSTIP